MKNRIQRATVTALVAGVASYALSADANVMSYPGSACFLYSGSESGDPLSRSGGNANLWNNTAGAIKVECPIQNDNNAWTFAYWGLHGKGTTGWSKSTCNLFGNNLNSGFATPTSDNGVTNLGNGYTQIGSINGGHSYTLGEGVVIICSVPSGSNVTSYWSAQ